MHLVKMLAALMLALVYLAHGQRLGDVFSSPHNQTVSLGDFVVFNCHATADSVGLYVYINGTMLSRSSELYAEFNFTNQILSNTQFNNTISFIAHPSHNNTLFRCRIQVHGRRDDIRSGSLIIANSPLSPSISETVEHLSNDTFMHTIHWEEPFTWENFPILHYNLNITNHSLINEEILTQMSIPSNTTSSNPAAGASNFTYSFTSKGRNCYGVDVALSATNAIGDSDSSIVHTGHPITISEVTDVEMMVVFQSNGTFHLSVRFQAPKMCPLYQYGTYYITDQHQLKNYGPTSFVQENEKPAFIEREVEEEFQPLQRYQFEVTVISCGISQVTRREFSSIMWCRNDSAVIADLSYYKFATIGVAVGCGLLACCCLTLVIMATKLCRQVSKDKTQETDGPDSGNETVLRRRSTRNRPPNLRLESNNPIYEGVTYEVTPGESLKSLSIPPSTPSIELSSRYTFDVAPKLPPPRKSSVCFNTSSDFSSE